MFTPLQRPSPWSASGHICFACQRQLLAAARRNRLSSTTTSEIPVIRDDVIKTISHDGGKPRTTSNSGGRSVKVIMQDLARKQEKKVVKKVSKSTTDNVEKINQGDKSTLKPRRASGPPKRVESQAKAVNPRFVLSKGSIALADDDAKPAEEVDTTPKPVAKKGPGFGITPLKRASEKNPQNVLSRLRMRNQQTKIETKETPAVSKSKKDEATQTKGKATEHEAERVDAEMQTAISLHVDTLQVMPLDIEGPPVPALAHGLDRVLFNPGVYHLQDPHSRVFNFDPYLQKIMPVQDFDFNLLKEYKTSSEDSKLSELAKEHNKKYVGSTSSMTGALSHFHYAISSFRLINTNMLSRDFKPESQQFTELNRAPYSIFLRWKNGTYAIDADKEFDSPNVLMMLGKSMEKLLTLPKDDFERYRKTDPRGVPEEERNAPEAFQFTTMGDLLMRSQLDAYDSRLPGNGTFDLKTRAVLPIRMDASNFEPMLGYELITVQGQHESYEREYCDMLRSTMLKYMLQARMGCMDGIFLAYHNIERLFGFQYLSINEIDRAMHGQVDRCLGDQEFKLSLHLFNDVLNAATAKYPEQSMRIVFNAEGTPTSELCTLRVFAEPMTENEIDQIQSASKAKIAQYERDVIKVIKDDEPTDRPQNDVVEDAPVSTTDDTLDTKLSIEEKGISIEEALKPAETNSTSAFTPRFVKLDTDDKRPLWSAQLLIENSVNGEVVKRPVNLQPSDNWTVNYCFVEADESDLAQTWSRYRVARTKRMNALGSDDEAQADAGKENYFMKHLRKLAEKGRIYRAKLDEAEAGQEVVVWTP